MVFRIIYKKGMIKKNNNNKQHNHKKILLLNKLKINRNNISKKKNCKASRMNHL